MLSSSLYIEQSNRGCYCYLQVTKMIVLTASGAHCVSKCANKTRFKVLAEKFPSFLPKEVENIKDPFARKLATRIERLPVHVILTLLLFSNSVLLYSFRNICLQLRASYCALCLDRRLYFTPAICLLAEKILKKKRKK